MLRDYCQIVRDASGEKYSPLIRQGIDIISGKLSEKVSLSLVAEELGISPNYLSTLFKKEIGKSFTDYLTEKRLIYAKHLLTSTDQSVSEIAAACGIPDQNYFARIFKSKEKMTPIQYRNSCKN
ncbi:MAG: AraC family transcriptional regulator [Butyrivibrio sp.]|nr:AraC family transcriptional regulator [Butyrivibrio sp.]